ncbi:MAG: hypothetical protein J7K51_06895 [Thermotogae bacterium]|nr:hypothetical protein [Thermotogota bacterium]
MFISFVLIQVKRTREKVKTSMRYIVFCGSIVNGLVRINSILPLYIPITVGTGVYLLSDSPKANDIMELCSIGQV